jgi:hypothetical protein
MCEEGRERAALAGRPLKPLDQKGWDTESLSGFMDHILLQIKW